MANEVVSPPASNASILHIPLFFFFLSLFSLPSFSLVIIVIVIDILVLPLNCYSSSSSGLASFCGGVVDEVGVVGIWKVK